MMSGKYAKLKPDWTAFAPDFWVASGIDQAWHKRWCNEYVKKMHEGIRPFSLWYAAERRFFLFKLFDVPYPHEIFTQLKTAVYADFQEELEGIITKANNG